jgi:DNA polymerase I
VAVDDEKPSRERVSTADELVEDYDPHYYETQLLRAVESMLSPIGIDRGSILRDIGDLEDAAIPSY